MFSCCDEDFTYDNDRKITGRGNIESESVVVDEFSSIDLENVSNVYVETGKDYKVVFTAYENILPYMDAVVIGDELFLRFAKDINVSSDEEIRVDVTLPELEKVTLSGVGNFYLNGPQQRDLELELDGVGNIEAYGLKVLYGIVNIDGTGNVEIDAKEKLTVDIDGMGNVYYRGDPELVVDINGLGEVVRD
jgi:hypothetical protein